MASNDVEVLDPAATVEKLKKFASEHVLNRRHFIAALGVAGAAAGTELVSSGTHAFAQQPKPNGYAQIDVLNFLLNLKYLKATLYSYITQGADLPGASGVAIGSGGLYNIPGKITFSNQQITDLFNEMYYDELNQLIALRALQGVAVVGRGTMNLIGTGPSGTAPATTSGTTTTLSQAQAIALLRTLEDLSASAFAGATVYLSGTYLAYATQAMVVDAAHAAALRLISIQTGAPYQSAQQVTSFQVGLTSGSTNVYAIGTLPATVAAGQPISAPGIPAGAVITLVTAKANATPSGVVAKSTLITGVTSMTGIAVGQPVTGTNIPALTYITAITSSPNTITLSQAPTTALANLAPTGIVTNGSNVVTGVSSTAGITLGQPITGTGIPANTTITATTSTTITMSAAATASSQVQPKGITSTGSNQITSLSSVTSLALGQTITDAGGFIPTGTTITSIGTNSLTISANATGNSVAAETLTVVITEAVSTPAAQPLAIGQNAITISQAATATSSVNATVLLSDPMDVAPVDPGTAALAAAGPAVAASSSPAVYQGIFDTAGGATSSSVNPAGMIFARTFQQVLAALYNYNSTTNTVATQNYEGGFFPFGVAGPINSVT